MNVLDLKTEAKYYKNFCAFKVIEIDKGNIKLKALSSGNFIYHQSFFRITQIYKYKKGEIFIEQFNISDSNTARKFLGQKVLVIPNCSLVN